MAKTSKMAKKAGGMVGGLIKKIMKKLKFMTKPGNLNKVLFLAVILVALYMLHRNFLSKEGFESTPASFEEDLTQGDNKKLVMFYAEWCPHCQKIKPQWDEAAEVMNAEGENRMMKVNCGGSSDEEKQIMQKYGIDGYPTIAVFEKGEKVSIFTEGRSKESFLGFFKN